MTRVRVESFTISLDGYGAGPNQDVSNPLALAGQICTSGYSRHARSSGPVWQRRGTTGVDEDFASRGFQNVGAWILGRNMFGPIRGPWPDMNWKGWWETIRRITFQSSS